MTPLTRQIVSALLLAAAMMSGVRCQRLDSCTRAFRAGAVCDLSLDVVLDIDKAPKSATACQDSCFRDAECAYFTFYQRANRDAKCVLFRDCLKMSRCHSCFTGPALPSIAECMAQEVLEDKVEEKVKEDAMTTVEEQISFTPSEQERPSFVMEGETRRTTSNARQPPR
jgi:hypothetical protein